MRGSLDAVRLREWAASLPAGLDTMVGAHGARLSARQRQRIAVAFTVLGDRSILIFDGPRVRQRVA